MSTLICTWGGAIPKQTSGARVQEILDLIYSDREIRAAEESGATTREEPEMKKT